MWYVYADMEKVDNKKLQEFVTDAVTFLASEYNLPQLPKAEIKWICEDRYKVKYGIPGSEVIKDIQDRKALAIYLKDQNVLIMNALQIYDHAFGAICSIAYNTSRDKICIKHISRLYKDYYSDCHDLYLPHEVYNGKYNKFNEWRKKK